MENNACDPAEKTLQESPIHCKANAVIDAFDEFLVAPSPSTRSAAMDAMQAYFAEADKVVSTHDCGTNR